MSVPAHWKRVSLLDVCTLNPRPRIVADQEVAYIDYSNIDDVAGVITSSSYRLSGEVPRGASTFRNGDVLFAGVSATLWKSALVADLPHELGRGPQLTVMRAGPELSAGYLWHFFQQPWVRQQASRMNTSTHSQPTVPHSFFKNMRLALPPFDEQLYIVDALEHASIVPYREALQRVQQLKGYLAAHLMLPRRSFASGWSLFKISDICQINPQEDASVSFLPSLDDDARFFSGHDLLTNSLTSSQVRYRDIPRPARRVRPGDVLLGLYSDKSGYDGTVVVPKSDSPQFVARELTVLRPGPAVSSHYLAELLQSPWFNEQIKRQAPVTHRSANDAILLARTKLTLPPLHRQARIVDALAGAPVQAVKSTLLKSREVYQALVREAFSGGLSKRLRLPTSSSASTVAPDAADLEEITQGEVLPLRPFKLGYRSGATDSLSRFQRLVWRALRMNAQTLIVDDPDSFDVFCTAPSLLPLREFISHNQIRRTLEQIAALGLIQKMSLPPRGKGDLLPYLVAFRAFRQDLNGRLDEDTALMDARMLRASILELELGL